MSKAWLRVNVPTLPESIIKIIINLLIAERSKLKLHDDFIFEPNDNPTVPNAEKTSNNNLKGSGWSMSIMMKKEVKIKKMEEKINKNARNACSTGILFFIKVIPFPYLPKSSSFTQTRIKAKLVVLMPPPVPPGEAPINIKIIIIIILKYENNEILTILKPAVLGVMAWKKAFINL